MTWFQHCTIVLPGWNTVALQKHSCLCGGARGHLLSGFKYMRSIYMKQSIWTQSLSMPVLAQLTTILEVKVWDDYILVHSILPGPIILEIHQQISTWSPHVPIYSPQWVVKEWLFTLKNRVMLIKMLEATEEQEDVSCVYAPGYECKTCIKILAKMSMYNVRRLGFSNNMKWTAGNKIMKNNAGLSETRRDFSTVLQNFHNGFQFWIFCTTCWKSQNYNATESNIYRSW